MSELTLSRNLPDGMAGTFTKQEASPCCFSQVEAYILWSIRDAPGQQTLKAFQAQPHGTLPLASLKGGSHRAAVPSAAPLAQQAAPSPPSSPVQRLDFSQSSLQDQAESQQDVISDSQSSLISHPNQASGRACTASKHNAAQATNAAQARRRDEPGREALPARICPGSLDVTRAAQNTDTSKHLVSQMPAAQAALDHDGDGLVQPAAKRQRLDAPTASLPDTSPRCHDQHRTWSGLAANLSTGLAESTSCASGQPAVPHQIPVNASHAAASRSSGQDILPCNWQHQGPVNDLAGGLSKPAHVTDDQSAPADHGAVLEWQNAEPAPHEDASAPSSTSFDDHHQNHQMPHGSKTASASGQGPHKDQAEQPGADDAGMARARHLAAAARASCDVLRGPVR